MKVKVCYMIASHNRRDELLKTIQSCYEQDYSDKEIHVVDDGSKDGSFEAVREQFPEVIITRNETAKGSVISRNQIFKRATGEILFGFDDDSRFIDRDSTRRAVERFVREPDLGLLDFQDIGPEFPERIPNDSSARLYGEQPVSSFGAGRFAIRRKSLEAAGLYPEFFWHAYEEPDLAIRIWDGGYRCLRWNDILVWHEFSSLNRNEERTHYYHARNELLSVWMRAPALYIVPLSLWRMFSQFRYSQRRGWRTVEFLVWRDALKMLRLALRHRAPVKSSTLRKCLRMSRGQPTISTPSSIKKVIVLNA
ncbi:MAG TPA: glycosyltransferase family A protein [Pyrinomonadaceae bacterium]|jgi:GT2 family glycosyltransferase